MEINKQDWEKMQTEIRILKCQIRDLNERIPMYAEIDKAMEEDYAKIYEEEKKE